MVFIGFIALALSFSARAALGLVMPVWEAEFGWSRTFISSGGALALIVMAVVAPFAGVLVDRRGPKPLLVVGLACIALGLAVTASMDRTWMFLLGFGGIGAIGFGIVATHIVATAVTLSVTTRPGLAVGVATAGATAGQLVFLPVLSLLSDTAGWRIALLAMIGLILAITLPVLLRPFASPGSGRSSADDAVSRADVRHALPALLRRPAFHALFWSFTLCGFTTTGVIETHLLPYTTICGFAPAVGATAFGLLSAVNMAGMILAGWLTDRVNRPALLAGIYFLRSFAFILLMNISGDVGLLMVFATLFGLFDYATVPVTASLVSSHLGTRVMGLAMGLLSTGHAIGGAAGAALGGWLFDAFRNYDGMWAIAFALAFAAGVIALTLSEPARRAAVQPG